MTLASELNEAAFWHEAICLGCQERSEEEVPSVCQTCGGSMVSAIELKTFVTLIEGEKDDAEGN